MKGYGSADAENQCRSKNEVARKSSHVSVSKARTKGVWKDTLMLAFLIVVWWTLSSAWNIYTKLAMQATPAYIWIGAIQQLLGLFWFLPLWFLRIRPFPRIRTAKLFATKILPQGFCFCLGHVGGCAGTGLGAVSFVNVVKATEPLTTAIISIFVIHHLHSVFTYMSLIPVVGGVALASCTDPSFNWPAFSMAMVGNVGCSARSVFAKAAMKKPKEIGTHLTTANLFALMTIISAFLSLAAAIIFEGPFAIFSLWRTGTNVSNETMVWWLLFSGFCHISYNEVAFYALSRVNQITHSVANTMKRICIIVTSIIWFRNPVTVLSGIGTVVAIFGTALYALALSHFG